MILPLAGDRRKRWGQKSVDQTWEVYYQDRLHIRQEMYQ